MAGEARPELRGFLGDRRKARLSVHGEGGDTGEEGKKFGDGFGDFSGERISETEINGVLFHPLEPILLNQVALAVEKEDNTEFLR